MTEEAQFETMREKWVIRERRNGAIFKTEFLDVVWRDMGAPQQEGDYLYVALSTARSRALAEADTPTMRRKK